MPIASPREGAKTLPMAKTLSKMPVVSGYPQRFQHF
jgi:hypothetical protein